MSKRVRKLCSKVALAMGFEALVLITPCVAQRLVNDALAVSVNAKEGTFQIATRAGQPVFTSRVAAQVNHDWLRSSEYPRHAASESKFADDLGSGRMITVTNSGLPDKADLVFAIQLYDQAPYAALQVTVTNTTTRTLTLQSVRALELIGDAPLNLGGPSSADRHLSDSYSADRPALQL